MHTESATKFRTDLEIAQSVRIQHVSEIAQKLGISEDHLEYFGKYKAKLPLQLIDQAKVDQNNLILVTAITPTPPGEGKTTTSIGLTEGLNKIGKKATVVSGVCTRAVRGASPARSGSASIPSS